MNEPADAAVVDHRDAMIMRSARKWADAINAWSSWLAASGASPTTIRLRRWYVRRLAEANLSRSPWKLSTDDLAAYLSDHSWGPAAMKNGRSSLRSFYRWATETGRTRHNPSAALPSVRVPPGLPRPAPDDALDTALMIATDRDRLMLMLAAYAGLRAAEIARLTLGDARTSVVSGSLIVRGKGRRSRWVPAHPVLAAELAAELCRREAGSSGTGYRYRAGLGVWLFPGSRGGPLTPGAVTKVLSGVLGAYTAHQLRHRFASRIYSRTHDLVAVKELMGHSQISTTAVYTALPDGALLAAIESVVTEGGCTK